MHSEEATASLWPSASKRGLSFVTPMVHCFVLTEWEYITTPREADPWKSNTAL